METLRPCLASGTDNATMPPSYVFATLKPSNTFAKLSFSATYENAGYAAKKHMHVEPEQKFHEDICSFRREQDVPIWFDESASETEAGSVAEQEWEQLGMIWEGQYCFDLDCPPNDPEVGWIIGKGSSGKVYAATNYKNQVIAIKFVERQTKTADGIEKEINVLRDLTKLAESTKDNGRILRLREVIYQNGEEKYSSSCFEDIALVLEPAVTATFSILVDADKKPKLSSTEAILLFYDALQGVQFLHSHHWIHRDLKPGNIGLVERRAAVIMDCDGAIKCPEGASIPPNPGFGGTVWYLSPEREMVNYDFAVDIWSMGLIFYELIFGYHPWKLAVNPWRPGNESKRQAFHKKYHEALEKVRGRDTLNPSLKELIIQMLAHSWAEENNGKRISIQAALSARYWQSFNDSSSTKRIRI